MFKLTPYLALSAVLFLGPAGCDDNGVGPCSPESVIRDWEYGSAGPGNTQNNIQIWLGDQERAGWNCVRAGSLPNGEQWECSRCVPDA